MATKYISGTIAGNYVLSAAYTALQLESGGLIQGLLSGNSVADTITSLGGTVARGVALTAGGTIDNATATALITGGSGANGTYPSGTAGSGGAAINLAGG